MYTLQHFKRMSATTQNNATQFIETANNELVKKTSAPAKNRADYITEVFEALHKVGCPLEPDQLWEYFNKAAEEKHLRKLSEKKSEKTADEGPKRTNGRLLFIKDFTGDIPEGVKESKHKSDAWKALSSEEKAVYEERARETNKSNGFSRKTEKITYDQRLAEWDVLMGEHNLLMDAYWNKFERWVTEDPETRGEKPERPERPEKPEKKKRAKKANSSSDTPEVSD